MLLATGGLHAHEIRPAYLQITQVGESEYDILWKVPARGDLVPDISPVFPSGMSVEIVGLPVLSAGAARTTYKGFSTVDLHGKFIGLSGLSNTLIDCLVRIEFLDGDEYTLLLQADQPTALIPVRSGLMQVAATYFRLGVEHILLGFDHLLFVLALLIITRGLTRLVKTITAFTVAHSMTLSLASLGFIGLPAAPVEAVIALSIVFLAVEIVHHQSGRDGWAMRFPWIVAFAFGLLHGLGFAGALAEIGLPQHAVPAALLFFNIGVEAGQLLFISVVLLLLWGLKRWRFPQLASVQWLPPYAIGSVAAFWLIVRIVGF
jgi:hydrogenase/urease accessory protein HupE